MNSTISIKMGYSWIWAGSSCTATRENPCRDHAADLGDDVYEALEEAWSDRRMGTTDIYVTVNDIAYNLSMDMDTE